MAYIQIVSSAPRNGAAGVLLESSITVITDTQLQLQSVNSNSVVVTDTGENIIQGTLSYSNHQNGVQGVITFSPLSNLRPLETYQISISSILGVGDETLQAPVIITFTAGEILSKTLKTSDSVTFFERQCYPEDGEIVISFERPNGNDTIESRDLQRYVAPKLLPFTVSVLGLVGGTITPSGQLYLEDGTSQTFTITANSGYELDQLFVDGSPVSGAPTTYTFRNIVGPHSINALFRELPSVLLGFGPNSNTVGPDYVDLYPQSNPNIKYYGFNAVINWGAYAFGTMRFYTEYTQVYWDNSTHTYNTTTSGEWNSSVDGNKVREYGTMYVYAKADANDNAYSVLLGTHNFDYSWP